MCLEDVGIGPFPLPVLTARTQGGENALLSGWRQRAGGSFEGLPPGRAGGCDERLAPPTSMHLETFPVMMDQTRRGGHVGATGTL